MLLCEEFEKYLWEKNLEKFLDLDLKWIVNDECSWDYPYIPIANDAENLF
jgi:hypothetical protein